MKLIIELADGDGREEAVRELLKWRESRMFRSDGVFLMIGSPSATGVGLSEYPFGWRITSLTAEN